MIATIILLSIYLMSALLMYLWVKLIHSKKGRWSGLEPDLTDVALVIVPVLNTIACCVSWFVRFPYKSDSMNTSRFFNIKK